jgi:EAL domain-containing protein (putative c-di-GMP-specific phosphodiesterase class I)
MNPVVQMPGPATLPYLEHYPAQGASAQRILLEHLPFRIGRSETAHLVFRVPKISKEHAEIFCADGQVRVRDLHSTNGTFVNGNRVEEAVLANGDILHLAHLEFRFGYLSATIEEQIGLMNNMMTDPVTSQLPASLIRAGEWLEEMIRQKLVRTVFQPIVDLATRQTIAFEALGRGEHKKLKVYPGILFRLAEKWGLAASLSQTFRMVAVAQAARLPEGVSVFLNIHPCELSEPGFLDHLCAMRGILTGNRRMVLEIHENAVADLATMRQLSARLKEADIGLAFDDYGVGQSRLLELAEVPPDYIKLDMSLIRDIDSVASRREVVQSLCQLIRARGAKLIAEGIETREEAQVCSSFGCHFGQGFLFGKPREY